MAVRKSIREEMEIKSPKVKEGAILELEEVSPRFNDGFEKAKVISIERATPITNSQGKVRQRASVGFRVRGEVLNQNFLLINHPDQPIYQLFMSVVGRTANVMANDLINKEVIIEIRNEKTEKGTFAHVKSINSIEEFEERNVEEEFEV